MISNCNNFIVTIIIKTLLCLWIGTTTYSRSSSPVFDGKYDVPFVNGCHDDALLNERKDNSHLFTRLVGIIMIKHNPKQNQFMYIIYNTIHIENCLNE